MESGIHFLHVPAKTEQEQSDYVKATANLACSDFTSLYAEEIEYGGADLDTFHEWFMISRDKYPGISYEDVEPLVKRFI